MKNLKQVLSKILVSIFLVSAMSASATTKDPIIFVHGYLGSTIVNFSALIAWFKAAGYPSDHLYFYNYSSLKGVKYGADVLKSKVAYVKSRTGKSKVDIITHSMGGLVARYYMKHLGGASNVDQLVNIASPAKGTVTAYLDIFTQAGKDLRPGSAVIKSMEGYYPGLNIWSSCDEIVNPDSSAVVGNASHIGCWEHNAATWYWGTFTRARDYVAP